MCALPVITVPKFTLTLPSTGKKHSYRPFLVKEEKILLIALEGGDATEMMGAMKDIIGACVENLDKSKISLFDLEYVFLKLREKSISDTITLTLKHVDNINSKGEECDHVQNVVLKLADVEILRNPKHTTKIQLNDTIGVVMKYPTVDTIIEMGDFNTENNLDLIEKCIDYIYDEEKTYPSVETLPGELKIFVENLTHPQLSKIEEFFNTSPKLEYTLTWKCEKCGSDESIILSGMASFFG